MEAAQRQRAEELASFGRRPTGEAGSQTDALPDEANRASNEVRPSATRAGPCSPAD